jgi:hypothetical protein
VSTGIAGTQPSRTTVRPRTQTLPRRHARCTPGDRAQRGRGGAGGRTARGGLKGRSRDLAFIGCVLLIFHCAHFVCWRGDFLVRLRIQLYRAGRCQRLFCGASAALFHGAPIAHARVHLFHPAARISVYPRVFQFILTNQPAYICAGRRDHKKRAQSVMDGCALSSFLLASMFHSYSYRHFI